ncbi:MAG: patatin-like phospholipase family protein [Prevotellaceae bacterium]|nr:patatin-like phospholipase family protein [Prevotellaceae bacterium]
MRQNRFIISFIIALIFAVAYSTDCNAAKKKKVQQSRPKIGLVLGGGGAKGAAEVGVLKYIEESGVKIDYIAGTSIGAIIGALYSVGYRAADLDSLFHSQEWLSLLADRDLENSGKFISHRDSTTYLFGFPIKRPKNKAADHSRTLGLSRGDSIVSLFTRMTGHEKPINFSRLPIPFRCVAVNIRKFQEVILRSGSLPMAMRASMAIPGVFKPVELDSMLLVDGGMKNNLPVDVVKEMGAEKVIAIDLTQNKHFDRKKKEEGSAPKNQWQTMFRWLTQRPDLNKYKENLKMVDIYINPDLKGCSAADFKPKKIAYMIEQGEKAGKMALKDLKKLASKR